MASWQRLFFKHIKTGSREMAAFQCRTNASVSITEPRPTLKISSWFHLCDSFSIEHPVGARRTRQVEGHEVHVWQQGIEIFHGMDFINPSGFFPRYGGRQSHTHPWHAHAQRSRPKITQPDTRMVEPWIVRVGRARCHRLWFWASR